jgi:hypothetical protein
VAHVDLSLSDLYESGQPRERFDGSLLLWSYAVGAANEPSVLINVEATVVAASPGCGRIFGIHAAGAAGRPLVPDMLRLLDFHTVSGDLPGWEVDKIPPLLAMTTGGLSRGLLRVPGADGAPTTVDAISVPLRDGGHIVGSLTFFAVVAR